MRTFSSIVIFFASLIVIASLTIDTDLVEINKLEQDFLKYTPEIARRFIRTTCDVITQCCPHKQSNLFATVLSGNTNDVLDKCFDGKMTSNVIASFSSCSPFIQLSTMITDSNLFKFLNIVEKTADVDKENVQAMIDLCTEQELSTIACSRNLSDEQNTCQRKLMRKWAAQGEKIYAEKVQNMKDSYKKNIDALKKAF
ncbi:unnamed protein product [Adineta ricciae]|uniref:Uncharacterized protein n=1 Tax=Adineta ricciae TaxID=249248 RepID=A0A813MRQ6_ADIRI|nr:unnamed protein product [Adineta ricciae]CAF1607931.1 unnamed protein product [Adineta ricciae]